MPFSPLSSHSCRCLMNVMTKRSYRTLLIPHISLEKAWSIDRPGGIDVSSLCIQTSSNEQHHVITSFKEALGSEQSDRSEVTVQLTVVLITRELKRCCNETDRLIKINNNISVGFRYKIVKEFQCQSLLDYI